MQNLYFILAVFCFSAATAQECPDAASILPCVCNSTFGLNLACENVASNDDLQEVFNQYFPTTNFEYFTIINSPYLTSLNFSTNNVTFRFFFVYGPSLVDVIDERVFADSADSLVEILLLEVPLYQDGFPFEAITGYTRLTGLSLIGVRLSEVPELTSDTLTALEMSGNGILELTPGVLANLPNLQFLDISQNPLGTLDIASVPFNDPSSTLMFSHAIISSIATAAFYDASPRHTGGYFQLFLDGNSLSSLDAGTIPITADTHDIFLQDNQIVSIERTTFYLHSFPHTNSISINLANNQLLTINEEAFAPIMPYIRSLNLRDNPLACGCGIAWIITDPEFVEKISEDSICVSGIALRDLDPNFYATEC